MALNLMPPKAQQMQPIKMQDKQMATLVVVGVIVICLVVGYFVFWPAASGYKTARIDFANLSTTKQDLLQQQANLESLKNDISERSDFISKTEEAMPTTSQIPELIVTLSNFANNNSLYITNFSPKEVASTTAGGAVNPANPAPVLNYNTVEIDFDITGSYSDLKQFIKDIETNIRPIDIVSISVSGGGQISSTTSAESLRFSIKAYVYYEKQG